jgi:hypothetical protein
MAGNLKKINGTINKEGTQAFCSNYGPTEQFRYNYSSLNIQQLLQLNILILRLTE